mmetsp:Transcript_7065/g.17551  ORF Transcript_7065/g.17551 Transcript_7065/m.17551 type:complete len:299 (-) Transcript_7065:979-1875(-)
MFLRIQLEIETAAHHGQCDDGLEQRKLIPYALALSAAKGQVREVHRRLVGHLLVDGETIGVKPVGLLPQPWVAVKVPHRDEKVSSGLDFVPIQRDSLHRTADEHGRLGVEPHRLVDDASGELQVHHVLGCGLAVAAHLIHLSLNTRLDLRVGGQEEGGPGEHRRCSLVARDEQGHEVVAELLGRDVVSAGDEKVQNGRIRFAHVLLHELLVFVLDDFFGPRNEPVEGVVHHNERLLARLLPRHQPLQRGHLPVRDESDGAVLGLPQHGVHRLDNRIVLSERVEVVVEHRLADDVQRQA